MVGLDCLAAFGRKRLGSKLLCVEEDIWLTLHDITPFLSKEDTILRKAIPVEERVAVSLWKLATNSDYRTIGPLF